MADSRPAVVEQPTERAEAFLRLADDHLDAAYRLARAILRDPTDAQDATHDAFEQAWQVVDAAGPGAVRAMVRPDPRQHVSRSIRSARRRHGHLGRGRDLDR